MHFDPSINVGNLIEAGVLLAGFGAAHAMNVRRFEEIRAKVNIMFRWFERHMRREDDEQ